MMNTSVEESYESLPPEIQKMVDRSGVDIGQTNHFRGKINSWTAPLDYYLKSLGFTLDTNDLILTQKTNGGSKSYKKAAIFRRGENIIRYTFDANDHAFKDLELKIEGQKEVIFDRELKYSGKDISAKLQFGRDIGNNVFCKIDNYLNSVQEGEA